MEYDYPNPQGLPRFIPPASTHVALDTECIACQDLGPIVLECWNDGGKGCKEFGAVFPDGTTLPLGESESIAMQRARAYANDFEKGERMPSEAWDGGLGGVIGDGL